MVLGIDEISELAADLARLQQEYDTKIKILKDKAKLTVSPNKNGSRTNVSESAGIKPGS